MSLSLCIDAMALPSGARVDQRVPKKLLLEQGAATTADKRKIQDGIEEIVWIAALKPNSIGVLSFKEKVREYLEIAVLTVLLRGGAKPIRLTTLIHRAIPYPVVLWTQQDGAVSLSMVHKRWSQGQSGNVVIGEVRRTASFLSTSPTGHEAAFLASLALSQLRTRDLYTLYQGWLDRIAALEAASIMGAFIVPENPEHASAQREALTIHARLKRELAVRRAQAKREKQLNRRVDLNREIKRLEARMSDIATELGSGAGR